MPTEVFSDDCRFVDPTTSVTGLSRYVAGACVRVRAAADPGRGRSDLSVCAALDVLFDPAESSVTLTSAEVVAPRQVLAKWTLGGRLKLPWRPIIPAFAGTALYTLGEDGLVVEQRETWSVSAAAALLQTLTPSFS